MKKIYTTIGLLFALTGSNNVFAQAPTITGAVMPQVGYTYNDRQDTTTADRALFTVTAGSASAQTWNYSTPFQTTYTTQTAFVSPSSGTGSSNFPSANLASSSGTAWVYYVSNAGGLSLNGEYIGGTTPFAVFISPNWVFVPTPFTYGNNLVNSFVTSYSLTSSIYTVKAKQHSKRTITADAFGSLTTPTATYPSTLRIKSYQLNIDTQWVYTTSTMSLVSTTPSRDSSVTYSWLQNSQSLVPLSINMKGNGTSVTSASYLTSFAIGIKNNYMPFEDIAMFPNPVSEIASLSYENKNATHVTIELFDLSGKLITMLANENQSAGKQTVLINTKELQLSKGMYFARISGPNGSETVKLSVN